MDFNQQIAGVVSRDRMHRFIDDLDDGDHAMVIIWRKDGSKRFVQFGMTWLAEISHMLGGFWQDFISGSWPQNESEE